jgi:NADH-quinone oxidoreductase subunit J
MSVLLYAAAQAAPEAPSLIEKWNGMILPALGQDVMAYAAFVLYLILIIGGGAAAVAARNLVRALVGLVITFLGVAGMYLLMASPFLAFMQLLIYVGAICVLIFFAIMLVRNTDSGEEMRPISPGQAGAAFCAVLAVLALFAPVIVRNAGRLAQAGPPSETPLAELGAGLLSRYVVPFEIISIVLLVAMAGGVLLARDRRFRGK